MNYVEAITSINWLAVIVAALATFVLGGIWYSPGVFGNMEQKLGDETKTKQHHKEQTRSAAYALICTLVSLVVLAVIMYAIGPGALSASKGFVLGLYIGCGVIVPTLGVSYAYQRHPLRYWLVNGGYLLVCIVLAATILGAWH